MKDRNELRRQLYREGKRMLGTERMARLRRRSMTLGKDISRRAARVRDRLRARGRRAVLASLQLERIDRTGLLVMGRLLSPDGAIDSAEMMLGNGRSVALHDRMVRFETRDDRRRRDGVCRGFAALVEIPDSVASSASDPSCRLRMMVGSRSVTRTGRLPAFTPEAEEALSRVRRILESLPGHREGRRALFDTAIGPAIERIWAEHSARIPPVDGACERYGERYGEHSAKHRCTTSVIVPIYGRCDFIEHQIAHFAFDPDFADVELIYVIDDPRLHVQTQALAQRLSRRFDLPFSVLYLTRNSGFAGANNAGVRHAHGRNLLLLNSDVLPAQRGWLSAMYDSVEQRLDNTLLGARLIYEDGTVQHDGMRFEAADSHEGQWLNRHPGKGLPADLFPIDSTAQPRQAVTAACLLMTRKDWDALGGFDESYLLGDFEDSDLCLRATSAGLQVRLATDLSLFHLERQSQTMVSQARWKDLLTYYNCWFQSRRWQAELVALTGVPAHG